MTTTMQESDGQNVAKAFCRAIQASDLSELGQLIDSNGTQVPLVFQKDLEHDDCEPQFITVEGSPLGLAVYLKQTDAAKLLLQRGAKSVPYIHTSDSALGWSQVEVDLIEACANFKLCDIANDLMHKGDKLWDLGWQGGVDNDARAAGGQSEPLIVKAVRYSEYATFLQSIGIRGSYFGRKVEVADSNGRLMLRIDSEEQGAFESVGAALSHVLKTQTSSQCESLAIC